MPRPRLAPRRPVQLYLPVDLMERVDKALYNPVLQERRFGALSALFTSLLREWLEKNDGPRYDSTEFETSQL